MFDNFSAINSLLNNVKIISKFFDGENYLLLLSTDNEWIYFAKEEVELLGIWARHSISIQFAHQVVN